MASTDEEKARKVKAIIDCVQQSENGIPERDLIGQDLAFDIFLKKLNKKRKTNADGVPAPRESTKNKEPGFSPPQTSAKESDRDELVPVFKLHGEARSGQPSSNDPLENLPDDSTTSSEVDEAMDVSLAEEPSSIVQKRQVSPAATKGDDSSAKDRNSFAKYGASSSYSTKNHEPGHRRTLNKKDFYSKMTTSIRETGFPTPKQSTRCTCQAELQGLQKAVQKMNDSLGRLTQTLEEVVKKIDTAAQDARIHRKGTQRLIAAANGGKTPTDSEDDASDVSADEGVKLW
ncbi:uncharacterized protein TrAtP1_004892 [Trichoderma atroviride]|uniref:uncharacterized protein n=1 Tax=Hypocrea atroviridis TaxID=63577 RepID=UPI003328ABCB|nr:hypothetical protein TrAtP1_004892 [Trichoderma atroviride]